jgi:Mrp family chromosome partitioning ATPase
VVLDTPPVALLTDANLLAAMIDLALLVVRANSTPYPLVRRAIEAIGSERILGVVLNRADPKESAHGAYYYAYSYRYAHSREPKRRRWFRLRRHRRHA